MTGRISYVDASALVKLVIAEPESVAMERWYVESGRVLTSRVGIVETRRAAARRSHDALHLDHVLDRIEVVALDQLIAAHAATIRPVAVRTLDAIHLATALAAQPDLDAFVTYDDRLAAAARDLGLPVVSPA
jgi:predicted nucleic acid-binding protein